MATPQEPQQPQRFVERRQPEGSPPSETPSELVVWQARQRFALTLGAILLLLLLVGGGMALLLLREWRTSLVQAPPPPKPSRQFLQAPPSPPTQGQFAQASPLPSPPANPAVTSPMPTPSPPTVTTQPPTPQPVPPPTAQPQHPSSLPKAVLDYLEQLRRIEIRRKREAKNIWLAIAALGELVKAMQGIASSGDILDAPSNYDPQKTLQTFATYQTNFAQLRQWLHRLQPPPECLALHQAYDQALQAHINTVGKLQERVQMKDLAGTAMMGLTAQGQISSALQAADGELAAVCARYGIQKFFSIGDE
ncbi:MAG: hypothetical protein HZLCBSQH_001033 [Candidatus Fervidibacterota bacterium]